MKPAAPKPAAPKPKDSTGPSVTGWIMLAVLVWGCLLAVGSYLYGGNYPELRAAIVLGVTLGFLALWRAALAVRRRRVESHDWPKFP